MIVIDAWDESLSDIDGDGDSDLLNSSRRTGVFIHENLNDGTFGPPRRIVDDRSARSPRGADMDGDGDFDILFVFRLGSKTMAWEILVRHILDNLQVNPAPMTQSLLISMAMATPIYCQPIYSMISEEISGMKTWTAWENLVGPKKSTTARARYASTRRFGWRR